MRRIEIPDGFYLDGSLSGNYACLIPGKRIEINGSPIALSGGGDALFLRLGEYKSNIYIVGQGHNNGKCYLYDSGSREWEEISPTTFGTNIALFGRGALAVVTANNQYRVYYLDLKSLGEANFRQIGSQGFRQVYQGELITGDDTYGPKPYNLAEFTYLGNFNNRDLVIGQGYNGGAILLFGGERRVLEPGNCTFLRAYTDGKEIAVFISKQIDKKAVALWFSFDEITLFPLEDLVVIPPPPPPPPPGYKPMKLSIPVRAIRDFFITKFPFPTGDGSEAYQGIFRGWFGRLIQQLVSSFPNYGFGWKSQTPNHPKSKDALACNKTGDVNNPLIAWDMFSGVGTGNPSLNDDPDSQTIPGQFFIKVEGKDYLNVENPPVENPPVDNELKELVLNLQKRVSELETKALTDGSRVAFRTDTGNYVTFEGGGGLLREQFPVATNRTEIRSWETITLVKK